MKKNSLFVLVLILTQTGCIFSSVDEINGRENLEKAFINSFGFNPSNEVDDIKARSKFVRDSYIFWLRATYTENTFTDILKHKTFRTTAGYGITTEKIWYADKAIFFDNPDGPEWYAIPDKELVLYYGKGQEEHFGLCSEAVWIDEGKQYIYYINTGQN
ncbi:hypothetical protein [Maribacter sp. 2210JD10-5]|uniref:hypothetical protein n=1 Tax=Maribacter sp. 2210JD10-5 TaxID=3386272 RepID=UPI0039BC6FE0